MSTMLISLAGFPKAFPFRLHNFARAKVLLPYWWATDLIFKECWEHSFRFQPVASAQPQHPPLEASGFSSLVYFNPIQSSAIVGWIPTVESNISFVTPHFMAIAIP